MTTPVVRLPEELRDQIVEHCLRERPNEGCGLFAMNGDAVVRVYPTENEMASPASYTVPPQGHIDALLDAESEGWRIGGVFHSHPDGSGEPSVIDVNTALEPDWIHLVLGLQAGLDLRAWSIVGHEVEEIPII